jgi:hypothetical protein
MKKITIVSIIIAVASILISLTPESKKNYKVFTTRNPLEVAGYISVWSNYGYVLQSITPIAEDHHSYLPDTIIIVMSKN